MNIAALKKAAENATSGDWAVDHGMGSGSYIRAENGDLIASCYWMNGQKEIPAQANARLIALANPSAILSLIERVGTLENALRTAHEAIKATDIGAFGWSDIDEINGSYPLKDELLADIAAALSNPTETVK